MERSNIAEFRSCVKIEAAVLMSLTVSVDVKQHRSSLICQPTSEDMKLCIIKQHSVEANTRRFRPGYQMSSVSIQTISVRSMNGKPKKVKWTSDENWNGDRKIVGSIPCSGSVGLTYISAPSLLRLVLKTVQALINSPWSQGGGLSV